MTGNRTGKHEPGPEKEVEKTMEAATHETLTGNSMNAGGNSSQQALQDKSQTFGANSASELNTIADNAAARSKPTVSHMLGEVTWLLSQSSAHKHFAIGDLEWLVMPPILREQFRVFHGESHPLGVALWAYLSEDAEMRMVEAAASGAGARLRPDDWKSGDRLWLVELVAPFATPENKLTEAMLADLVQNVFREEKIKLHVTDPNSGKREVREIGG